MEEAIPSYLSTAPKDVDDIAEADESAVSTDTEVDLNSRTETAYSSAAQPEIVTVDYIPKAEKEPVNGSKITPTVEVNNNVASGIVGVFSGIDGRRAYSAALANCCRLAKAEPRRFAWLNEKATFPMTIVIAHTLFSNPNRPVSIEELKALIASEARRKPTELQEEFESAMRQLVMTVKQRDRPHPMGVNLELLPGGRIIWRGPQVLNRKLAKRFSV